MGLVVTCGEAQRCSFFSSDRKEYERKRRDHPLTHFTHLNSLSQAVDHAGLTSLACDISQKSRSHLYAEWYWMGCKVPETQRHDFYSR